MTVESIDNRPTNAATASPVPPSAGWRPVRLALGTWYLMLILAAICAAKWGIAIREDLYLWSDPIRFTGDITNGWNWGSAAAREGVVALYDRLERENAGIAKPRYGLDYPPIRTALVARWGAWTQRRFPVIRSWQRSYEFSAPMLWANTIAEMLSAIAVFLIVRAQSLRSRASPGSPRQPGQRAVAAGAGFAGAMLLWFNIGVLFDAHAFPQWDMWIMPLFLFAVWAAMGGWFFVTGLLLAVGALIKGQMLWAAPLLLLWPAFALNWRGVLGVLSGAAAGIAAGTWPWLVRGPAAHVAVALVVAGTTGVLLHWRKWKLMHLPLGVGGAAALVVAGLLGGSFSWWKVGFEYGANLYKEMYTIGVSNLCTILKERFGYSSPFEIVNVPLIGPTLLRSLLLGITSACLIVCAAGAARHWARRDARFLVAVATPFVLFYALMPQMHDRYLVWGAAATALLAGVSVGMTLVHLGITAVMWCAIMRNLCLTNPDFWPEMTRAMNGVHVGIGYALLVLAAILLYHAGPWPLGGPCRRISPCDPNASCSRQR